MGRMVLLDWLFHFLVVNNMCRHAMGGNKLLSNLVDSEGGMFNLLKMTQCVIEGGPLGFLLLHLCSYF